MLLSEFKRKDAFSGYEVHRIKSLVCFIMICISEQFASLPQFSGLPFGVYFTKDLKLQYNCLFIHTAKLKQKKSLTWDI